MVLLGFVFGSRCFKCVLLFRWCAQVFGLKLSEALRRIAVRWKRGDVTLKLVRIIVRWVVQQRLYTNLRFECRYCGPWITIYSELFCLDRRKDPKPRIIINTNLNWLNNRRLFAYSSIHYIAFNKSPRAKFPSNVRTQFRKFWFYNVPMHRAPQHTHALRICIIIKK